MLDGQRVLGNMVLFHCECCNNRFPTWHPRHKPEFELQCLKTCSIDVHTWKTQPGDETTQHATLHHGICMRCHKSKEKVKDDPLLQEVATFSARNNFDPLFGLDEGRAYKTWLRLAREATVVESMLVSLNHMQVSVCYFRGFRNVGKGMPGFHKNIISFPQDLTELKHLKHFFSNLQTNDVVNVRLRAETGEEIRLTKARVVSLERDGVRVEIDGSTETHLVSADDVEQRVCLPWKPKDLADHLIIFRRRQGRTDEYVDDLRVRRNFVYELLTFLMEMGTYRPDQGYECRHMYYNNCDRLT